MLLLILQQNKIANNWLHPKGSDKMCTQNKEEIHNQVSLRPELPEFVQKLSCIIPLNRMTHYYCSLEVKIFLGLQLILRNLALHTFCFSVGLCSSKTQNFIMKTQRFVHPKQSMTEATFLTLGRSRSSHFKKLGIRPKT